MQGMLSHYRIVEQIGAGGMGVVYRAHDEHLDCDVALKVLTPGRLADDAARRRFRNEALALSKVNHPNIAVVHDFDTQGSTDFLVEELIPGRSLDQMTFSPLSEREIIHIGSQLCEGLAAAHDRAVIHRDLKPSNVRVTPDGRVKILDFGLAKMFPRYVESATAPTASLSTEDGKICGTAPYMAPEQLLNEKIDARTDIWAVGCILYEMATGHCPFRGTGPAVAGAILHQAPSPPSKSNPRCAPGLERAILKCLEKDPSLRYQSSREIAVDLRRIGLSSAMVRSPAQPFKMKASSRHLALRVAGWVLFLAVIAGFWLARTKRVELAPTVRPSIAVLPFVNMSADKDQEYFSDGLAEELLDTLAKIPELRVAARTSSFQFKGKSAKLADIGRELNVATILEGSVREEGKRLRISAQLIKVSDGFSLWSETYDRELNDVLAVEQEIAQSVAASLKVTLLGKNGSERITNPAAYNAYLQGQYFRNRRSEEDLQKSVRYYEQAIQLSPGYALAWAGLAGTRSFQSTIGYLSFDDGCREARDAAQRALGFDPDLPEAHVAMAEIQLFCDWDWNGADRSWRLAAALAPGNVKVLESAAEVYSAVGHFGEALALRQQVIERDPLNPASYVLLGIDSYNAGQMDQAATAFKKALELNPNNPAIHTSLGRVYLAQARPQEALSEVERETSPGWRLQGLALAHYALAHEKQSDDAMRQLIENFKNDMAYQIAEVYAFRGESDRAFTWLQRAVVQHDAGLVRIIGDPLLKGLENEPRYIAILEKMRLPI